MQSPFAAFIILFLIIQFNRLKAIDDIQYKYKKQPISSFEVSENC